MLYSTSTAFIFDSAGTACERLYSEEFFFLRLRAALKECPGSAIRDPRPCFAEKDPFLRHTLDEKKNFLKRSL
jgi:hypothetical protein